MIFLNAGNLWTDEYLDHVISLNIAHAKDNIRVQSLFGSISTYTPTARSSDRIPYLDEPTIAEFIGKAERNDIHIRYTLNASCLGSIQDFKKDWDDNLRGRVENLHKWGVHEWVVTSALLCEVLRDMFPEDFIEVSTISEVKTPSEASRWKNLGADGANLSTSINRDFMAISGIESIGNFQVSLLANEACLYNCPYRRDCYNLSSHNSDRGERFFQNYPFGWCNNTRIEDIAEWLKARIILPQWMAIYQARSNIEWFKIAFRTHPIEVALPILELYMNQYHGGNYLDLWPTIRHLGNTEEPADSQNLSCRMLDEMHFLENKFLDDGYMCATEDCGLSCTYCDMAAKEARQ